MSYTRTIRYQGLGDVSKQQITSVAASGASTALAALVAAGAVTGPVGAAIGGLIAAGAALANMFSGCGQTCIQATQYANAFANVISTNKAQYFALPAPRTTLQQAQALQVFDAAWADLQAACSNPNLDGAGQRCISERQRGGKFDAPTPFRDPIANDQVVTPAPTVSSVVSSLSTSAGSLPAWLIPAAIGAAVLVAVL